MTQVHPHVIKFVLNDRLRIDTLRSLKWRFGKTVERKPQLQIVQDRLDHIKLIDGNVILLEYTIIILPVTINWDRVYSLRAGNYTALDFADVYAELDRVKSVLESFAKNPDNKPGNSRPSEISFACMDWRI